MHGGGVYIANKILNVIFILFPRIIYFLSMELNRTAVTYITRTYQFQSIDLIHGKIKRQTLIEKKKIYASVIKHAEILRSSEKLLNICRDRILWQKNNIANVDLFFYRETLDEEYRFF